MKAYYLNKNKRLCSVDFIKQGQKQGFNIPEQHVLIAIEDETGAFVKPEALELSEFEQLFLNKHKTADYLGFLRTAEMLPAGFRLFYTEPSFYDYHESVGTVQLSMEWVTTFIHNLSSGAPAGVNCRVNLLRIGGFQIEEQINETNTVTVDWIYGDESFASVHGYYGGNIPYLVIIPEPYSNPHPDNDYPYKIENYETDNYTTGYEIRFGEDAKARYKQMLNKDFQDPVYFGWPV